MEKTKQLTGKKDKPRIDNTDWHRLSFCDARVPAVAKIEKEIGQVVEMYRRAVLKAKKDRWAMLVRLPAREAWSKDDREGVKLLEAVVDDLRQRWHRDVTQMYEEIRGISLVREFSVNNIIPTAGRAVIARWLTGDNTYDADVGANYGSLGDDNTAPTNSDTTLGNEIYRKATSSAAVASNVAYLSNFYTASEVSGLIEEAAWHIDGTGSADTGQLLSHFLTGTINKATTETLTVESAITIT